MKLKQLIFEEVKKLLKETNELTGNGSPSNPFRFSGRNVSIVGDGSPTNPLRFIEQNLRPDEKIPFLAALISNASINLGNYRQGRIIYYVQLSSGLYEFHMPAHGFRGESGFSEKPITLEKAKKDWEDDTKEIQKILEKDRQEKQERDKQRAYEEAIIPLQNIKSKKRDTYKAYRFITLGADWCAYCKMVKQHIGTTLKKDFDINYEYISVKDKDASYFPKMHPQFMEKVKQAIKLNDGLSIDGRKSFDVNTLVPNGLPVTFILEGNNVIGFTGGNFFDKNQEDYFPSYGLREVIALAKQKNKIAPFGASPSQPALTQPSPAVPTTPQFKAGDVVQYHTYGYYKIVSIQGDKATITSTKAGTKAPPFEVPIRYLKK